MDTFELKTLSRNATHRALRKAERYRLLGEPREAESICLDILKVDPENQEAVTTLLLSITDRFQDKMAADSTQAQKLLPRIRDAYQRAYYAGIICQREAKAKLNRGIPEDRYIAYGLFKEAMGFFEEAEAFRPFRKEDAILRWNTCVRLMRENDLSPKHEQAVPVELE